MSRADQGLKGKNVLITGGLGFIGSNLARACLQAGARVTVFDCLDPRSGGNLFNVHGIENRLDLCFHNILDFDQVCDKIVKKDLVFNCAASTSHSFSMKEPWIDMDVNSRGVINLLEAIRRFNPSVRLVQLGTSTQLGKLHYRPADELHPEFPMDIYSANKSVSEKYVIIYARSYQVRATVVRLTNVYGPRASIHSAEFTFNNFFVGQALQGRDITVFGDGAQKRNVLFVDDAVRALIAASKSEDTIGETLFAAGDSHFTVAEIAKATVAVMGRGRVCHTDWPRGRREIDVGDAVVSNQKLKSLTGWAPRVAFEEGLKKTKTFYLRNLERYLRQA